MIYTKLINITFSDADQRSLDGQSRICNWLYNQLLDMCKKDYETGDKNKYLSGRNLRNQIPALKKINEFLKTVHSSPLKNVALRLKDSYVKFFRGEAKPPHFRSWKKHWFSLFFDEPNKGFKIEDKSIKISLGKNEKNKQLRVTGELKETLKLKEGEALSTFRLCKKQKRFYGVFTIEKADVVIPEGIHGTWVAIDPNHKNFFETVDNTGTVVEYKNLKLIKYWDEVIDSLKSKRDVCKRKAIKKTSKGGKSYYVPSKRWIRLDKALTRAYECRREQIKQACYSIAHDLCKKYEKIVMGNYVPSIETAKYDNMHRSMLNQTVIGTLRKTLKWVCTKSARQFEVINEKNTTSDCCMCGYREYKDPSIREFDCKGCGTHLYRDANSAVNIALKAELILSGSDYLGWDLSRPLYTVYWDPYRCICREVTGATHGESDADESKREGSSPAQSHQVYVNRFEQVL